MCFRECVFLRVLCVEDRRLLGAPQSTSNDWASITCKLTRDYNVITYQAYGWETQRQAAASLHRISLSTRRLIPPSKLWEEVFIP